MAYTRYEAIHSLVGGSLFANGDDIMYIDGQTPPTDEEIDAEIKRLEAQDVATQYQRDRQYPDLGEQLDMQYWDEVNGTTKWKDTIAKIKADNPKN
jgi:hypothetical protein